MLFDRTQGKSSWEPARPPEALGELLDSRYMLPLLFPSDPRMLAASPKKLPTTPTERKGVIPETISGSTTPASAGSRGALEWRLKGRRVRDVGIGTLRWVDGAGYASRWSRTPDYVEGEDAESSDASEVSNDGMRPITHITPLTRKPSSRIRTGRTSMGGDTAGPILEDE